MPKAHELMLAVRDGDIEKLGVLFEEHHRHLFNFFLKQTGNREVSEDLVQEVFFRMLKYRHTYRADGKFTTWMFSIAHNARIDHYRKNRYPKESMDEKMPMESREPNPEELAEMKDNADYLRQALAGLSDEKREVLVLSRYYHMKYEEIAEILKCPVGTIKARVHWAIKDLTEKYRELTGDMNR